MSDPSDGHGRLHSEETVQIRSFDQLDSTQLEAKRLCAHHPAGRAWVIARQQTAGVGRRQRAWAHPQGNFAGTLIWPISRDALKVPAAAGFGIAVAISEAIEPLLNHPDDLRIKWPNDVLWRRQKLAGILIEHVTSPAGEGILLIGIGINLIAAPAKTETGTDAACIADDLREGLPIPVPAALAQEISRNFSAHWNRYLAEGFEPLRQAWSRKAVGIGEAITVNLKEEQLQGEFEGISPQGALRLRQGEAVQDVLAGDIFLGPNASSVLNP